MKSISEKTPPLEECGLNFSWEFPVDWRFHQQLPEVRSGGTERSG